MRSSPVTRTRSGARAGAVETLLPATLGNGRIPYARGVRAGPWVFASGILAADDKGALAPEAMDGGRPLSGLPRWYREALCLYRRAEEVLAAGGTDLRHAVRTDQYFPDWHAVPFLHLARKERCGDYAAPSTSVFEPRLPIPGAGMAMEMIAVRPGAGLNVKPLFPAGLDVPSTSAFAPVAVAGDYVFVAGFLAAWKPGDLGGIDRRIEFPIAISRHPDRRPSRSPEARGPELTTSAPGTAKSKRLRALARYDSTQHGAALHL